jgi:hypothetical protein
MMQKSDKVRVDNPGAGDCGFYAFAIGLLNLIVYHQRQDLLDAWVQKDAKIEACLRDIIQQIEQVGFEKHLTGNKSLMFPFAKSLQTILMTQCHAQIELFGQKYEVKDVTSSLPFVHFGELVEYVLKNPDAFFEFNPLFYNEKLRRLAKLIAIEVKKEVNAYFESLYPGVREVLSHARNWRRDYDIELSFLSFHEMVEEISFANQRKKNPDTSKNPLFFNRNLLELARRYAITEPRVSPSFFAQLEAIQQNMVIQAVIKYADEFKTAYRVYIDGYYRKNHLRKSVWFATDEELRCLAQTFKVSLCCLSNSQLNNTSLLSESIFLNNEGRIHWTTYIYQQQPLMKLEPSAPEKPVVEEERLEMEINTQQKKIENLTRINHVLPELLTQNQVRWETRKLELLQQLVIQKKNAELLEEIDDLESHLNAELMQMAADKIKQLPEAKPLTQKPKIEIPKRSSLFQIHDEIAFNPSKPVETVSEISPYWSIPFGLGLGELIILAAPQLVDSIALHLTMSIFQAHLFILLLSSLLMMISVLYSEKVSQDAPLGAPQPSTR